MQRDALSVDFTSGGKSSRSCPPEQPCFRIIYDGSADVLERRFRNIEGPQDGSNDVDITYRYQASELPVSTGGVLSITDRVTGEFLLEANVSPNLVERFLSEMSRYANVANPALYRVEVVASDHRVAACEPDVFLVYGSEGNLIREVSVIPDGMEI